MPWIGPSLPTRTNYRDRVDHEIIPEEFADSDI
jgi:hypothetical protein